MRSSTDTINREGKDQDFKRERSHKIELPERLEKTLGRLYTFERRLGNGNFGEVWLVYNDFTDEFEALKVLNDDVLTSKIFKEFGAVSTLSNINAPNIVKVFDAGEIGGVRFIASEYVEGCSLYDLMTSKMTEEEALDYVIQAARGLEAAHSAGILHFDLKPENILLTKDWTVKIADFGTAEMKNSPNYLRQLIRDGLLEGTAPYLPDEMILNIDPEKIDARVDIYAMGVILNEMLSGKYPFDYSKVDSADGLKNFYEALRETRKKRVPLERGRASRNLARILDKAIASVDERYQTIQMLRRDLENYLAGKPTSFFTRLNETGNGELVPEEHWCEWEPVEVGWRYTGDSKAARKKRGRVLPEKALYKVRTGGDRREKQSIRYNGNIFGDQQWLCTDLEITDIGNDYELTFQLYSNPHRRNTIGEGYAFAFKPNLAGPEMRIKKHGYTVASRKIDCDLKDLKTVIVDKVGKSIQFIALAEEDEIARLVFEDSRPLSSDNYSKAAVDFKNINANVRAPRVFVADRPYGSDPFADAEFNFSRQNYRMALEQYRMLQKKFPENSPSYLKARYMEGRCLRRVSDWMQFEVKKLSRKRNNEDLMEQYSKKFNRFDKEKRFYPTMVDEADNLYLDALTLARSDSTGMTALKSTLKEALGEEMGERIEEEYKNLLMWKEREKVADAISNLRRASGVLRSEAEVIFGEISRIRYPEGSVPEDLKPHIVDAMISKGLLYEGDGEPDRMLKVYQELASWNLGEHVMMELVNNCTSVYRKLRDRGDGMAREFGRTSFDYLEQAFGKQPERLVRVYKDLSESDLGKDPIVMTEVARRCNNFSIQYKKDRPEIGKAFWNVRQYCRWKNRSFKEACSF